MRRTRKRRKIAYQPGNLANAGLDGPKDRAMTKLTQSYVHGASTVRLIGETLGAYFDRAVARWRDELALVVRHQQVRWNYGELAQQGR